MAVFHTRGAGKAEGDSMHVRCWWAERGKITLIGRPERASIAHPVDPPYARVCDTLDRRKISFFEML